MFTGAVWVERLLCEVQNPRGMLSMWSVTACAPTPLIKP